MSLEADLVRRYGPDVLKATRRSIPPRRARKGHQLAVQHKAGRRSKLVKELKQEGYKAHVTRHRVTKEVTANLVFTNALPAFAKHAASVLAEIPTREILNLYGQRPPKPVEVDPFEAGDQVVILKGPFERHVGTVISKVRKGWNVDVPLFGSMCTVTMATHSLRKHDPG